MGGRAGRRRGGRAGLARLAGWGRRDGPVV